MSTFISLFLGVPLGIASSMVAWWLLAHAIRPRLSWHHPRFVIIKDTEIGDTEQLAISLRNECKRPAIDLTVHGELRVKHKPTTDGVRRTLVRFPLNSSWMPRLQTEAHIRVEVQNIPKWEWDRLCWRVGTKQHELKDVIRECENSSIRFYALAYDKFSGARKIFVKDYDLSEIHMDSTQTLAVKNYD